MTKERERGETGICLYSACLVYLCVMLVEYAECMEARFKYAGVGMG